MERLEGEVARLRALLEKVLGWKREGFTGPTLQEAERRLVEALRVREEEMARLSRRFL